MVRAVSHAFSWVALPLSTDCLDQGCASQPGHLPRAVRAGDGHGPAGPAVQVHGPCQPCGRGDLQPRRCVWVHALFLLASLMLLFPRWSMLRQGLYCQPYISITKCRVFIRIMECGGFSFWHARFLDSCNARSCSQGCPDVEVIAARRFASISRLAGKQLEPYVAQLIPKLYRCVLHCS